MFNQIHWWHHKSITNDYESEHESGCRPGQGCLKDVSRRVVRMRLKTILGSPVLNLELPFS